MSKGIRTATSGAKHNKSDCYGRKQEAKEFSRKNRRQIDRMIAQGDFNEGDADDFSC